MLTSVEIRQAFLTFFQNRGHTVVPSSSLIPGNDPTLLFTNAGMVQFKDTFTGIEKRSYTRATTAQKCMRVSGKHNDLENVGPSPRHHTFFEMLGNFSFGDYFKRDAIAYAWEFLTQVMDLDPARLYPTIYLDDDEAFQLWQEVTGVPAERIDRRGKKDNFWTMGDTGPNGPCSEIHYDRGPQYCTCGRPDCSMFTGVDCERWWELWNLVFMQFETSPDGTTHPLPKPSIDTGMGMERLTAVMQGKDNNYETDLFWPIIQRTQELLGHSETERQKQIVSYRVIADHARSIAFLITDGVLPGNEGRSYVLRLILRRAARHGKLLGFQKPFMAEMIQVVMDVMGQHYDELLQRKDFVLQAVTQEEERFLQTLDVGINLLDQVIADAQAAGQSAIPGDKAFRLYDTYGFPLDLTRDVAKERGLRVDEDGFKLAMEAQRERARAAQRFEVGQDAELYRSLDLPKTAFVGYEELSSDATVLTIVRDGQSVEEAGPGQKVEVVLDRTPFYGESGGQVADTGVLLGARGRIEVHDTRHPLPELTVHYGVVAEGVVVKGERLTARVEEGRRLDIARNHTATHLLHRALQKVVGQHVRQAGSLVSPERLRFDFTHLQPVTAEELRQIEREVNAAVRAALPVEASSTTLEKARASGAMALFGEKYGDVVRLVCVGDSYSRELCGGTHLRNTGQIGYLHILSESSIGSGLRRIEAVTGRGAEAFIEQQLASLAKVASVLQTTPEALEQRAAELTTELRQQQRDIERTYALLATKETEHPERDVSSPQVDAAAALGQLQVSAKEVKELRELLPFPAKEYQRLVDTLQQAATIPTESLKAVLDQHKLPSDAFARIAEQMRGSFTGLASAMDAASLPYSHFRKIMQEFQPPGVDLQSIAANMQVSFESLKAAVEQMRKLPVVLPAAQIQAFLESLKLPSESAVALAKQVSMSAEILENLAVQAEYIAGVKVLAKRISASNVEQMRELADRLRQSLGSAVIVLGAVIHDKPMLIAAVTPDLVEKGVQAGKLLSNVAKIFGGGGGGKPTMAQAGGEDASKLDAALRQVPVEVGSELQQLR